MMWPVVSAAVDALGHALVRPGCVVVHWYSARTAVRWPSPRISTRSGSSRRRVPTRRSQIASIRGAWTAVCRILVPVAWKMTSNEVVKSDPPSRIGNLMLSNRSSR